MTKPPVIHDLRLGVLATAAPAELAPGADLESVEVANLTLRRTTLATVDGVTSLRGATVGPDQLPLLAPLMAHGLGLRVES